MWKNTFPYEGKQMIDPQIRYANEPSFRACVLPYFKANFLGTFHQPIHFARLLVKQGSLTDQEGSMHAPKLS